MQEYCDKCFNTTIEEGVCLNCGNLSEADLNIFKEALEGEKVDKDAAKEIGDKLKVDWKKTDINEFAMGIGIESEHTDTVGDNEETFAKIALDHLKEDPSYYSKLKKAGL